MWTSITSAFVTLGVVGGMERFWISTGTGCALITAGLIIAFAAVYKGGF